jgi:hypothetical protein
LPFDVDGSVSEVRAVVGVSGLTADSIDFGSTTASLAASSTLFFLPGTGGKALFRLGFDSACTCSATSVATEAVVEPSNALNDEVADSEVAGFGAPGNGGSDRFESGSVSSGARARASSIDAAAVAATEVWLAKPSGRSES